MMLWSGGFGSPCACILEGTGGVNVELEIWSDDERRTSGEAPGAKRQSDSNLGR